MTEQELREIEARWSNRNFNLPPDIEALIAEVRRLRCCGNCSQYAEHLVKNPLKAANTAYACNVDLAQTHPWAVCTRWEAAGNG